MKYDKSHFRMHEYEPDKNPQNYLADVVFNVKTAIARAFFDDDVGLSKMHPRTVVSIVMTNIMVNTLFDLCGAENVRRRLEIINETLDEIKEMTLELWHAMEANKADTGKIN